MSGFPECDSIGDLAKRQDCISKKKGGKSKSLDILFNELNKCDKLPGNGVQRNWCKDQVRKRWIQGLVGPIIYPWANFNWDYQQYVKNNYDPINMGLNIDDTSATGLMKNIDIIIKLIRPLIITPNPGPNSIAGVDDQIKTDNPVYPLYRDLRSQILELQKNPIENASKLSSLKETIEYLEASNQITAKDYGLSALYQGTKDAPPYSDPFFNKPLRGKSSSSYFIQSGFCQTPQKNQDECEAKGFSWIGEACYKGKYLYMDNSPGLKVGYVKNMEGLIPSLINDATQLSPSNYIGILQGYGVPGLAIQKCDDLVETFFAGDRTDISYSLIPWVLLIGVIMYLFYARK